MKSRTGREKDRANLYFLRQLFAAQEKAPPEEQPRRLREIFSF